ncbi:hypothetical protein ABIC63_002761 [Pseudacidovorax sp. 1753]
MRQRSKQRALVSGVLDARTCNASSPSFSHTGCASRASSRGSAATSQAPAAQRLTSPPSPPIARVPTQILPRQVVAVEVKEIEVGGIGLPGCVGARKAHHSVLREVRLAGCHASPSSTGLCRPQARKRRPAEPSAPACGISGPPGPEAVNLDALGRQLLPLGAKAMVTALPLHAHEYLQCWRRP